MAAERRIAELSALKDVLQRENEELRAQLEETDAAQLEEELEDLKRECEERLGTAEKTIILLRSERESLLKRLESAAKDGEGRTSELSLRDKAVADLRSEGELLAKKEAASQAQLRKLRAALRDCEGKRDELVLRVQSLEQEAQQRAVQSAADTSLAEASEREAALSASLSALQDSIAAAELRSAEREDALQAEVSRLQRCCSELEASRDESAASGTDVALPLLRQLEELSRSAREAADASADSSARLLARAQAAEAAAAAAQAAERSARARAQAAEDAAKEKATHTAVLSSELAQRMQRCDAEQRSGEAARLKLVELSALTDSQAAALADAMRSAQQAREEEARLSRTHTEAQRAWRAREAELLSSISELQGAIDRSLALLRDAAGPTSFGDVELQAMQRRVSLLEAQLTRATERAAALEQPAHERAQLSRELDELRSRHTTALRALGERSLRVEELALDLSEARDIYRAQSTRMLALREHSHVLAHAVLSLCPPVPARAAKR